MWVKICGLNSPANAAEVARLGPDAVGLNFYEGSSRCVSTETAAEIVAALPAEIEPVGVFVNCPAQTVAAICRDCRIATAQIHGDETPEYLCELQSITPELRLICAHRVDSEGVGPLAEYIQRCRQFGIQLAACLVDSKAEGVYGGSGEVGPWDLLGRRYLRDEWPKLILAGGLQPDNVAAAIRTVRPWGVDVASGVESAPGLKDPESVKRFMRAARDAQPQSTG